MNEEMKQKLEKYLMANGYYDTRAIRRDEGYDELTVTFLEFFSNDLDQPEKRSELLEAAVKHNDAKYEHDKEEKQRIFTAEKVMEEAINSDDWPAVINGERFQDVVSDMNNEQRALLGNLAIARLHEYKRRLEQHDYQNEKQRHNLIAWNNRMLDIIVLVGRGTEHGDIADQTAYVVIDEPKTTPDVNELIEEELARLGL